MKEKMMIKNFHVSKEAWEELCKHGKFGDTMDDLIRRILGMRPRESRKNKSNWQTKGGD